MKLTGALLRKALLEELKSAHYGTISPSWLENPDSLSEDEENEEAKRDLHKVFDRAAFKLNMHLG
jgi:hypothetical protein